MKKTLQPLPTSLVIFLLAVALVGFADSAYLTLEHYRGVIPPCSVTSGCEDVLTSAYATVFGVPVALGGAVYYLLVLVGVFAYLEGKREKLLRAALMLTFFGFAASLWFLYVQAFILHSYCQYCLVSATTSTILFATALWVFSKYRSADTLPA